MLYADIPAADIRLPDVAAGTAVRVTRYGQAKAYIVHPSDFQMIEDLVDAYRAHPPIESELTDLELVAHQATDAPEDENDYDYAGLAAALGD